MALLKPILNSSFIFGSTVLNGVKTYVGEVEFLKNFSAELQFFSISDSFLGDIRLDNDSSNYLKLKLTENKIGGLKGFQFEIDVLPNFSFFNLMKIKFFINSIHSYTGELLLSDQQDDDSSIKSFSGRGYVKYLDDIDNITVTYENKTLKEIIIDQIETNISPNTPIEYDSDKINPPDITITKMEFSDKSVAKIFNGILEIANKDYNIKQYTYGVDKDMFFYFSQIETEIKDGFFEGYQFQKPKVKQDDSKIINELNIYRAKENQSDELEFVSSVSDAESQSRYGLRKSKLTVNEYIDNDTVLKIANAKLNRFKDPFTQIDIKDLEIDNIFEIGFYKISSKIKEYKKLINDCEDLSLWNLDISPSTIQIDNDNFISGKNSFKWESPGNAAGNTINLELNETIMYPTTLIAYFKQNSAGTLINMTVYDEDNNEINAGPEMFYNILTEDGGFFLTEDNDFIVQEDTEQFGVDIKITEDWFLFEFDISAISNIKKIAYFIISDDAFIINLDRIEVISKSYFTRELTLDKANYELDRTGIKFNGSFGENIETIIDDLKKVENENKNILGLFEK